MFSLTSPVKSPYHNVPPGPKFFLLMIASITLFLIGNIYLQAAALAFVLGLYLLPGGTFFKEGLRMLWPLWPFVGIVFLWHAFTHDILPGLIIILRMISAVALANLVTMTSQLDEVIALVTRVVTPFRRFGLRPQILALSIVMFIRFLPVLIEKGGLLVQSWRSRSTRPAGWRVVVPLALLALDDADTVAEALRARGGVEPDKI